MTTQRDSPRGRFVRPHPRKLERRFVNIPSYQEEVDRQNAKPNPLHERQLKLALPAPETLEEANAEFNAAKPPKK